MMRQRGFSLIEVLVATAILAMVTVGLLSLFDTSAKISKAQTATSEVQENVRYSVSHIVRVARMAGSGGLPAVALGTGAPLLGAVDVDDDTTGAFNIAGLTPIVGTDLLELRGAFGGDIVDLGGTFSYNGTLDAGGTGTVTIAANTVGGQSQADKISRLDTYFADADADPIPVVIAAPLRQDLALADGRRRAQALYGTALLTGSSGGGVYTFSAVQGDEDYDGFLQLSAQGLFPPGMENPSRMTMLDVVRFFVAYDQDGVPTLYRNEGISGANQPLVTDIVDLQVALGCDRNQDGVITESADGTADEWLFNADGEAITDLYAAGDTVPLVAYLTQMRLTVVSRIPAADPGWDQHSLPPIFNENGRDLLADPAYQGMTANRYRYRALTERVKMRSLGPIV